MRIIFSAILFIVSSIVHGQDSMLGEYGFRHLQMLYKSDTVHILIKSKKGDEEKKKPLLLFCQGSLPVPLIIKYNENGTTGIYGVFVFNPDSLAIKYHLAIIGKPSVPVVAYKTALDDDLTYHDSTGKYPRGYVEKNYLDYYVDRNIAVIKYLDKLPWISGSGLVVAGHSEGAAIAAKIAYAYPKVTHLIYSGGSPLGRVMAVIERARAEQNDSTQNLQSAFDYWKETIDDPDDLHSSGDTYKGYYQFSVPPPIDYLTTLKIPVLVTYGTKDYGSVAANDYLRVSSIRLKKDNYTFKDYPGLEHNFFPLKANGDTNYDIFNWDKVAEDWRHWLEQH